MVSNICCSTIADLSFLTWDKIVPWVYGDEDLQFQKTYPNWHTWNQRLMQRPTVQKIAQGNQKATSGH
jgi:glutathione S-transferase